MVEPKEPLTWNEAIRLCVDIKKKEADRRDSVVAREADIAAAMEVTVDDGPDSLADHKRRLGEQSARLAAAEAEVRRLRQLTECAVHLLDRLADVTAGEDSGECVEMAEMLRAGSEAEPHEAG